MDESQRDFAQRVGRVVKRHRAMHGGYTATLRDDGLIVVRPYQVRFKLPLRGFVLLMASFMIFKGFLLAYMGLPAYEARLDTLAAGQFGTAGAWIMGVDPVTDVIARLFSYIL